MINEKLTVGEILLETRVLESEIQRLLDKYVERVGVPPARITIERIGHRECGQRRDDWLSVTAQIDPPEL